MRATESSVEAAPFDALRFKLRGTAEAAWLWIACDASTKLLPAFQLGPRTQALAHQRVHELSHRLARGCLPVFSSDGLTLYFYALTAHFGQWVQDAAQLKRRWLVDARLLYAQLIKRYRRRRLAEVCHHVYLGSAEAYRQACALSVCPAASKPPSSSGPISRSVALSPDWPGARGASRTH
jgi:hypothetical protein